jgi:hypothetical protein
MSRLVEKSAHMFALATYHQPHYFAVVRYIFSGYLDDFVFLYSILLQKKMISIPQADVITMSAVLDKILQKLAAEW